MTPFLAAVHFVARQPVTRRLLPKFDALQTMIERESSTYFKWLNSQFEILGMLSDYFTINKKSIGSGKLMFVGQKRSS